MENTAYLDTHVVVWLYNNDLEKFPEKTLELIENNDLLISPMVILELEDLYEIKRLNETATTITHSLQQEINLTCCPLNFSQVISNALTQKWTRDPFDRMIVAQADINQAILISKDEKIREHYNKTFWL
jgi:PIN domain nuclease of toxin-antitoxin system